MGANLFWDKTRKHKTFINGHKCTCILSKIDSFIPLRYDNIKTRGDKIMNCEHCGNEVPFGVEACDCSGPGQRRHYRKRHDLCLYGIRSIRHIEKFD